MFKLYTILQIVNKPIVFEYYFYCYAFIQLEFYTNICYNFVDRSR